MVENKRLEGFKPPEEKKQEMDYEKVVYDFVKKKVCTYPAEVRRALGLAKDTAYDTLYRLERDGFLEKHDIAEAMRVPFWMKHRLQRLWDRGIKGDAIRRMSWYTLAGIDEQMEKYKEEEEPPQWKIVAAIDCGMNCERGVEPSEEQKKAAEELKDYWLFNLGADEEL